MFITTPNNQVLALDAKTGTCCGATGGRGPKAPSFRTTPTAAWRSTATRSTSPPAKRCSSRSMQRRARKCGRPRVADNKSAYYISLAPLVADDKVMIGASGGEFGVRGFVAAFDPDTGKELWRTLMVPAPGEPGSETWPKGDQWKTGGAPVWVTGNYDPETNLAFWGTGNGGPWMGDQRPGDNLYTASTVAIDVATGHIKGHFQYNPNESWDWDEVSPPILVDYRRNGRTIKGLINVARNGYLWFLERTGGPISFVEGKPYVTRTCSAASIRRPASPTSIRRASRAPARPPSSARLHGGKNWPPIAFNPQTRMIYIPANNNMCGALTGVPVTYRPARGSPARSSAVLRFPAPGADHVGEVQAWNVDTGQKVWTHNYKSPNWGSMLATAGGLVFIGGTDDRKIHAFDAATGKLLWEFETNSGIVAPPTTFMIDGKQYLAVLSGWGGDAAGMNGGLGRMFPGKVPEPPEGGGIWVFALP